MHDLPTPRNSTSALSCFALEANDIIFETHGMTWEDLEDKTTGTEPIFHLEEAQGPFCPGFNVYQLAKATFLPPPQEEKELLNSNPCVFYMEMIDVFRFL